MSILAFTLVKTIRIGSRNTFSRPPVVLPPPAFRRAHLALVQPEVVRHLVPDRLFHQLGEVLGTARHALVGALENRDAVRHRERFEHAPRGQRTPFIETQQGPAAVSYTHLTLPTI